MKKTLPLVVLMVLGAWSGCAVEGRGLQAPDASAAGGVGGVSHAGGAVASGGASALGDGSGGGSGNTGAPVTDGEVGSDDAQDSGGISGSEAGGEDVVSGSGGISGSDAGAEDVASGSGGTSGSDAGAEDVASGSGGTSGSDAGVDADDAPQSGGSSGSDGGTDADDTFDSAGPDAGLGANDGASSDGASGTDVRFDSGPNWRLVWSDEFNLGVNAGADPNNWNVATWEPNTVNGEQQKYTARVQNVFHDGQGDLVLRGLDIPWTNSGTTYQYTSGRLQTDGKFEFSFGRVEVRAKLPAGQGSFPAVVLMGTTGKWPQCGEIGMMEQLGQDKTWLYCSTYAGGASGDIGNQKVTFPNATTLSSDFHVYALEWYSDHMVFLIDDVQVAQSNFDTASPFYTGKFYIILDVAIGGSMGGTIGDASAFPMDMVLDYVRVYSQ